jgi:hypothetical protein
LIRDEANPLIHCTALSPRHRLILPADRELSPIHPVYCVTYLSGLDKGRISYLWTCHACHYRFEAIAIFDEPAVEYPPLAA